MMGVKNPSSFEESTVLSCMFENNHNANPSCRCLEGNLSFCRSIIWHEGGRGKRNSTQILNMTLTQIFVLVPLVVSSGILLYAQEITKHQIIL